MKLTAVTVTKRDPATVKALFAAQVCPIRWRLIHEVHQHQEYPGTGLGELRNFAVDLAIECGSDLVAIMDDDDWYGPGYVATLIAAYEADHRDALLGMAWYTLGWLGEDEALELGGGNIRDRQNAWCGQEVIGTGEPSWVLNASLGIPAEVWRAFPTVRYGDKGPGEDGALMLAAQGAGIRLLHRPATEFVAVRHEAEDGMGGRHGHTWGPVWRNRKEA